MDKRLEQISKIGIVPVIEIDDAKKAVPLARALAFGGLPAAEVTFRTAAAEESISRISQECPEVLIGAGTVLTCQQVDKALGAGAKFIVTPGFNPDVVRYAISKGALVIPGTSTPGEMEQAMGLGLNVVKFFPAEQIASLFSRLFDVPYLPNETAVFAGSLVECIKGPYLGVHGHIAIGTRNVDRAVYQLEKRGMAFDETSRKVDCEGHTTLIYLKEEIGGVALHLVKR